MQSCGIDDISACVIRNSILYFTSIISISNIPMISETLNLWSNGAVTLPKEWREQWPTKHFIAEETVEGYLLIKPIVDVEFYEDEEGFGLRFPSGISMEEFLRRFEEAEHKIALEEKKKRTVKKVTHNRAKKSTTTKKAK